MHRVFISALAGVATVFAIEFGGEIEGRFVPVVSPLTVEGVRQPLGKSAHDRPSVVEGSATKLRGCNFVRVEWFLGPRNGRRVQVRMEFRDPPQIRGPGVLHWTGIWVELSQEEIRVNSHADVLHKCGRRPWLTRSPYYDPPAE